MSRHIDEPIGTMLQFIAKVAHSPNSLAPEAKELLKTLKADGYLTRCFLCDAVPTVKGLCHQCRQRTRDRPRQKTMMSFE